MKTRIVPYTAELEPAVRAFNQRLAAGGSRWRFPPRSAPEWLARSDHAPAYQEFFLLLEGEHVRGAYALKHQPFRVGGELRDVGACYLPMSEGAVDNVYASVALQLFRDALRRTPLLFGLGLGGPETPVARLVRALGWTLRAVPFYFRVQNGSRFLRHVRYLRRTRWQALLCDLGAISGLGGAGARLTTAILDRGGAGDGSTAVETPEEFGTWADALWEACRARYSFIGLRDRAILNNMYPRGDPRFLRLEASEHGTVLGWAVVRDTQLSDDVRLGDLRIGRIDDCLALPEHAAKTVRVAVRVLARRDVDLLVSSQSHPAWGAALRTAGFVPGPSSFVFAASPQLQQLLAAVDPEAARLHLNRGDGDGPWGWDETSRPHLAPGGVHHPA